MGKTQEDLWERWDEIQGRRADESEEYHEGKYLSYKHYPVKKALADAIASDEKHFKVTTINWTFATRNGKQDLSWVHKNEYDMTLGDFISWITNIYGDDECCVAEDIIGIEPMDDGK